jgi:hypothetical protein
MLSGEASGGAQYLVERKPLPKPYKSKEARSAFADTIRSLQIGQCFSVAIDPKSPRAGTTRPNRTKQYANLQCRLHYFNNALGRKFSIRTTLDARLEIHRIA